MCLLAWLCSSYRPLVHPLAPLAPRSRLQLLLAVSLVRVPQEHTHLRLILRLTIATALCELTWRGACRGGSYARWRHLLAPPYALLDIMLSRHGIVRAGLDTTETPAAGAQGAAHLAKPVILSSRFSSNLVAWCMCRPPHHVSRAMDGGGGWGCPERLSR